MSIQRLQSARDLAIALRATVTGPGLHQPAVARRRFPLIIGVAATMLLIGGIGTSVYFLSRRGHRSDFAKPSEQFKAVEALAVLPFENVGGDPKTEYLSDGVADHLVNSLSQVRRDDLKVRPFSSVSRYKRQKTDVPTMGRELKVQVLVVGTLHQQGDDLSISVALVDARDDNQLWGNRYQGKLGGILALQDQIARDVAANLRLRLTGEEDKRLTKHGTQDPEAYQLYLYGRHFWNKRTEEGFMRANEYFRRAIEKDVSYSLAYAGLADSYNLLATYGFIPPSEGMPSAKAAALKALEIDEKIPEAHATLAFIRERYDWNWSDAERGYKRAIELNPNYPTAHLWYAYYLGDRRRFEEAAAESRIAHELDPLSLMANSTVGWAFYFAGQYDQAIEHLKKTLTIDPHYWVAHDYLGRAYYQKGMYDEAIVAFQRANAVAPSTPIVIAELGCAYAVLGKKREAQAALDELTELSKLRYVPPFVFALVCSGLGEKDRALEWLEKAYKERSAIFSYLEAEPMFDGLRSDPRVIRMLKGMGSLP